MPTVKAKSLQRRRSRQEKLAKLRAQYADKQKSKADVMAKVIRISPGLSEEEFLAPLKKK